MLAYVLGLFVLFSLGSAKDTGKGGRIAGKLNVHLVCHTHDDVGWLKTVDQYYYGANNSIQDAGVQYILDTVVPCLVDNPNRKFIYVEQAYFQRWWNEQTDATRDTVKNLVKNSQLEFINGGWCMHDEAATHYVAMVDQTTLGHRFLKKEFDAIPKVGWQIDPFGHSATQAALLSARVGFDGLFFARIDYQDSEHRNKDKAYEMIWRPSPSLGTKGQVFTGAFERNGYGPPRGFNWDTGSGDAPIQDDPRLEDYNVKERVDQFVADCLDQFSANRGDDIMLTLGSDFEYSNAYTWYKNLDKLIDHVNADGRLNIFYSTPSIYVKAKQASGISWPLKTDDFFPYADCPHCYWTGYFTSRPALKHNVRVHSGYLNAARQVEFLGKAPIQTSQLEQAVGVAQHHDAVSGTSKQHVAYDYARRIGAGRAPAENMVNSVFSDFVGGDKPSFVQCSTLNETFCQFTQSSQSFVVLAYNPLGRSRQELVRLPVSSPSFTVYDNLGRVVTSQVEKSFVAFPKHFQPSAYVLYFRTDVPALGFTTYFVRQGTSQSDSKYTVKAPPSIENSLVKVDFNSNGEVTAITNKRRGFTSPVTQQFLWYQAVQNSNQNSGAYIFRPEGLTPKPACTVTPTVTAVQGKVVSEVRSVCGYLASVVRIVEGESFVEFEFQTSAIPIYDGIGKEIVNRFTTTIQSATLSYTDSNGREFQQRKKNFRPTWNLTVTEPVAGNYYPVNVATYIKDSTRQFSVLTDRSQGGASLADGQVELMFHRRLLWDDGRGVGEPLNETDGITPYPNPRRLGTGLHITGSHFAYIEEPSGSLALIRGLQSRLFSPLLLAFSPLSTSVAQWISSHTVSKSWIATELPLNVDLMTLQNADGEYILRLSHQFGVGEDPQYSQPVTVDLSTLFAGFTPQSITELSLTTNQEIGPASEPFHWKTDREENSNEFTVEPFVGTSVTINPMDIRTFSFK